MRVVLSIFALIVTLPFVVQAQYQSVGVLVESKELSTGIGYYHLASRIGFYATLSATIFKPPNTDADNFYDNISENTARNFYQDDFKRQATNTAIVNAGPVIKITDGLSAYLGVGYVELTEYKKFYDRMHILSDDGDYWIKTGQGSSFNVNGGLILMLSDRVVGQAGYLSKPIGLSIGVAYNFN